MTPAELIVALKAATAAELKEIRALLGVAAVVVVRHSAAPPPLDAGPRWVEPAPPAQPAPPLPRYFPPMCGKVTPTDQETF